MAQQLAPAGMDTAEFNPKQASQRQRLVAKQQRLTSQLATVNAAIAALDENPNLEKFIDLMGRAL